jgi:hypothetical protein
MTHKSIKAPALSHARTSHKALTPGNSLEALDHSRWHQKQFTILMG